MAQAYDVGADPAALLGFLSAAEHAYDSGKRVMTRTKICCISSVAEAQLAVRHGASAIGLVSEMPSGPGVIPESLIREIAASVPPPVATVLLTSLVSAGAIVAQQKRCRVNTIQICDRLEYDAYSELREALPGIALVQVLHVTGEESVSEALEVGSRKGTRYPIRCIVC
jgi:phosphoribosylanthranilate isomerase